MDQQPDLLTWARANYPKDTTRTDWFKERIAFIFEEIPPLISNSFEQANKIRDGISVIYEKSSDLENVPEILIKHPKGLEIVLFWTVEKNVWESRWFVSIKSPVMIKARFDDCLFSTSEEFYIGTFKGLPISWERVPAYGCGSDHFEFNCRNSYRLHTIIWLIGQNLGLRKKK